MANLTTAERSARWRAAHPDRYKASADAYRAAHPDRIKAAKRSRRPSRNCVQCGEWSVHEALGRCRPCYKKVAAQRPGPKAVANARSAAWNEANREKTRAYFVDRMASDPEWAEKRRAHWRAVAAADPEANRRKVREWQIENPEAHQVQRNARRAQKLAAPSDLTAEQWGDILADHDYRCRYCGRDGRMTMDHAVPLSRGGHHTASNVVPACQPCNNAKGVLSVEEFLRRRFTA